MPREDLFEEIEEEDEEYQDAEEFMVFERLISFVREDVCTDIRFPIMVTWFHVSLGMEDCGEDEEMDANVPEMEPSKMNLFSLENEEEEEMISYGISGGSRREDIGRDERTAFGEPSSSGRSNARSFNISSEVDSLDEFRLAGYLNSFERQEVISLRAAHSKDCSDSSGEDLRAMMRDICEENRNEGYLQVNYDEERIEEEILSRAFGYTIHPLQRRDDAVIDDIKIDDIDEIFGEKGFVDLLGEEVGSEENEFDGEFGENREMRSESAVEEEIRRANRLFLQDEEGIPGAKRLDLRDEEETRRMKKFGTKHDEEVRETKRSVSGDEEEIGEAEGLIMEDEEEDEITTKIDPADNEEIQWMKRLNLEPLAEARGEKRFYMNDEEEIRKTTKSGPADQEEIGRMKILCVENEEGTQRMKGLDLEDEEEIQDTTEGKKDVNLKIILVFWFVVVYFYLRYFYEQIFTVKQITRATSTLRPFQIHSLPTSTTTLLEHTKLREKLNKEEVGNAGTDNDIVEEEEEENDILQGIIDYDEHSSCWQQFSSLDSSLSTARAFPQSVDMPRGGNSRRIENEVEETLMYLSERVTENVTILPFFTSEENVTRNAEESEISVGREPQGADFPSPIPFKSEDSTGTEKKLNSTYEVVQKGDSSKKKKRKKHSSSLDVERLELHGLSSTGREVDDCSIEEDAASLKFSSENHKEGKSLNNTVSRSLRAEVKMEDVDEVSNADEVCSRESERESKEVDGMYLEETRKVTNGEEVNRKGEIEDNEGSRLFEEDIARVNKNNSMEREQIFHTHMQSSDSFDSTFTVISETSRNTIALSDLNASSMEEFTVSPNVSNEST